MTAREATRDETDRRRLALPVRARRPAGRDFSWITLQAPPDWTSRPGQFVNVLCEADPRSLRASEGRVLDDAEGAPWPETTGIELGRPWPVARRPYSIARVRSAEGHVAVDLLVRGVGRGSRFLRSRPIGSAVDVLGPLGTWFTPPEDDRLGVLVAGGCGLAPIFGLADALAAAGREALCFFGAGDVGDMPVAFREPPEPTGGDAVATGAVEQFAASGTAVVLATDDGSAGFHGTAVAALRRWIATGGAGRPLALYGCGPEAMLRALAALAEETGSPCQVSLERWMGCGVGLCLSCAHKRKDAARAAGWTYRLTCREGPVVDARDLVWNAP